MKYIGTVVQILSNLVVVNIDSIGQKIKATIKGNIKNKSNILVGDIVEVEKSYDTYIISKIYERKNYFIRPPVANIDNLIICISLIDPKPDYLLLDKQIIFCLKKGITPIICLNKIDRINENKELKSEVSYLKNVYGKNNNIKIILTSAKENTGLKELKKVLENKISAFSGNSGVGKSSITSKIINDTSLEIGEISRKNKRGKNTTKDVKLYGINKNTYILDTPGFSNYELYDIEYKELKKYYNDFQKFKCVYEDCMHVNEKECIVKQAVLENKIDSARYERYKYIYLDLFEKDKRKYR